MLKYKKKRIVRVCLAVFIPLFLVVTILAFLHYYRQVDFKDIDLVSKTKEILYPSDKKTSENAKMTETGTSKKTAPLIDTNLISNSEDSTTITDSESEQMKLITENFYDIDTLNIQKDVMIAQKTYSIRIDNKENRLDSLLMNHSSQDKHYSLSLEFWLSPIGFTGYKKSVNKAIVYGIADVQNTDLIYTDNNFYLIVNNAVYLLEPSNNFSKLINQNSKSK